MAEEKYFKRKQIIDEESSDTSVFVLPNPKVQEIQIEEKEDTSAENLPEEVKENALTISAEKEEILERIKSTNSIDELKDLANLFGISITKKEIERASKESDLLDTLLSHAEDRIQNKGDYLSNAELLEYLKVLQTNVDKSKKNLNTDVDEASSKYSATHNEVNITVNNNGTEMTRESREKIMSVINSVLYSSNIPQVIIDEEEVPTIDTNEEEESL